MGFRCDCAGTRIPLGGRIDSGKCGDVRASEKIMPKEETFFDLSERHAAIPTSGAATMGAMTELGPQLRQVGALPWRRKGNGLGILLATSRETRRWIIPKGWAMKGLPDHGAASQEAYEEAGVEGIASPTSVGFFDYDKRRGDGAILRIRVEVYALEVMKELRNWPEKSERARLWFSPAEAALLVHEQGLAELIMAFARKLA